MFQQRNMPGNMLPFLAVESALENLRQIGRGPIRSGPPRTFAFQSRRNPTFDPEQPEYLDQLTTSGNANNLIRLGQLGQREKPSD